MKSEKQDVTELTPASSSGVAELLADVDRPGGWLLLLDRIRQSYVDLDDPTYLDFEYIQSFADVLGALPSGPLDVVHVGGGACTFARYVAATRPGSAQIVFEPDTALTELVRARLPLPRRARIRIRPIRGREGVAALRDNSADLVVLDAFLGGRVPAELSTVEFIGDIARVLRSTGTLLVNVADGPPGVYARRLAAAMRTSLPHTVVIGEPAVFRNRRFGNLVLAASADALPTDAIAASAARAMFPRRVLGGAGLTAWLGGAVPLTDASSMRSPEPPNDIWRVSE